MVYEKVKALENDNRLYFEGKSLRVKDYWNERENAGKRIDTLWNDLSENSFATKELSFLFDGKVPFDNPKPTDLIKRCLKIANKNSIVLDFFAGSGTTGQAVAELNKEDGGNRKFILCTNNENNICEEVTYNRLKNVIYGTPKVEPSKFNLKYYKTQYIDRFNYENEDYYIINELSKYIKELIQLENGIDINNEFIQVLFSDEEIDDFYNNNELIEKCKLYVDTNALITDEQRRKFENNNITILYIPEYYFEDEIMEVEQW